MEQFIASIKNRIGNLKEERQYPQTTEDRADIESRIAELESLVEHAVDQGWYSA